MRIIAFIFTLLFSVNCFATETAWHYTEGKEGAISLINGGYENGDTILAALHMKFKPGWHTYWKYTGETGTPVTVTDAGSTNIINFNLLWPAPKRIITDGIEGWVYGDEVIIPIRIKPKNKSKDVNLKIEVKWAICNDMCLFDKVDYELNTAPNYSKREDLDKMGRFMRQVPANIKNTYVKLEKFDVGADNITSVFSISGMQFNGTEDVFIAEDSKNFRFPKPTVTYNPVRTQMTVISPYQAMLKGAELKGKKLSVTVSAGEGSFEFEQVAGEKPVESGKPAQATTEKKTLNQPMKLLKSLF